MGLTHAEHSELDLTCVECWASVLKTSLPTNAGAQQDLDNFLNMRIDLERAMRYDDAFDVVFGDRGDIA